MYLDIILKMAGNRNLTYEFVHFEMAGNEACDNLATLGLSSNMIVYLTKQFHMPNVMASYVLNVWGGTTNFTPLLGAFLSDSYVGRYWTISVGCMVSLIVRCVFLGSLYSGNPF